MMSVLTAPGVLGDLLKREYDRDYCREDVELASVESGYTMGAVLGRVTASGIYAKSPATGNSGEETACAVLLQDIPPNGTRGLIVARGPVIVADKALVFDTSVNTYALKSAKHLQLAAFGIVVRNAV